MKGTLVNAIAIIIGSGLGMIMRTGIPDKVKTTIMQGIGLTVSLIGIKMAFKTQNEVILIASLVIGGIVGEMLRIDYSLERLGKWLNSKVGDRFGDVGKGFVATTLIYCVGAMAVVGAIKDGIYGQSDILYAKAMLDGISAIVFASTMGIGVALSAVSVFIYQGIISFFAGFIGEFASEILLNELTAAGGVLILGIGLTMLEIKQINVANLLPSIAIAVMLALVFL